MIVGFAPGGGTDVAARVLAQSLTDTLKQSFIVDNRPGASGTIGTDLVAKSPPDGYTLSVGTTTTHSVAPQLLPNVPYHPLRDFAAVTQIATSPLFLVVHPSMPVKSAADVIRLAKARPGQLVIGNGGIGTTPHMAGELFKITSGTNMLAVPYKGEGPAIIDLIGGQISLIFSNLPAGLPHVRSGKLRGLAVTSIERVPTVMEFPTVSESGLPGYQAGTWFGLFAPAATPRDIVEKLAADSAAALNSPQVKDKVATQGLFIVADSPEQFSAFMKSEYEKWGKVINDAGMKMR